MPTIIRWFVKTAFIHFLVAFIVAVALAVDDFVVLPAFVANLRPVYFHLFMVGWVTQLIFGVSIWMFPASPGDTRFGNETLIWSIYVTLNLGLVLRFFSEPLNLITPGFLWNWGLVCSAALQWVAGLLYVINMWRRVRGK